MPTDHVIHFQADRFAPRLDQYLAEQIPHLSRSQLKKLIQENKVFVSDQSAKPNTPVRPGEEITVHLPHPKPAMPAPELIPLDIIFEDRDLVVVNKPARMVVHPAHGHKNGTLVNALIAKYPDLAGLIQGDPEASHRPGLIHRLDQDTSGLIVIARTSLALEGLRKQFKAREVNKTYLALVFGQPEHPSGIIDVPLGRDPRHRQKIAPDPNGKLARTRYRVVEAFDQYSLLEIDLETGRTHQIRVHLAWLKCPVVGDTVYGRKRNRLGLNRQFLHAWRLCFQHPRTDIIVQLEAPLAGDLAIVLQTLRQG